MGNMKNKQNTTYLSNFGEEDMKMVLSEYATFQKLSNSIRIPGFVMLGVIGISRALQGIVPKAALNIISIIAILSLLAWTIFIGFSLVKQKKLVKNKLEQMSTTHNYPFKVLRSEFNTLVTGVYSEPKI